MRLLVTGGSGLLGRELVRQAVGRGDDVIGTRLTGPGDGPVLDVRDAGSVRRLIVDARPDAVIHTAYRQAGERMRDVNVGGSASVAEAVAAAGARLVHLSTDVVFNGEGERAWQEADAPDPVTDYGRAKADAELAVASAHPGASIVRTSLLYAGDRPAPHEALALDAADGRADVRFFTDEVRCPIAVPDLAAALLELLGIDHVGTLHVAGPVALNRFAFAGLIAAAHGRDPARLIPGLSAETGTPRPLNCALDTSLARSLLQTPIRPPADVLGAGPGPARPPVD